MSSRKPASRKLHGGIAVEESGEDVAFDRFSEILGLCDLCKSDGEAHALKVTDQGAKKNATGDHVDVTHSAYPRLSIISHCSYYSCLRRFSCWNDVCDGQEAICLSQNLFLPIYALIRQHLQDREASRGIYTLRKMKCLAKTLITLQNQPIRGAS